MAQYIKPFNGLWMDCITNNLIAMLASENEAFLDIACHLDAIYLKKVYNQSYSSEEIQQELLFFGSYFPKIQYSIEMLDKYLFYEIEELDQYDEIHNIIKSRIQDGYCVFVTVDRYYYPSGVNSNTSHMIHPTFIYSYNDEIQSYSALEDCIVMGKMNYYNIPYKSIDLSCEYFKSVGKKIKLSFYKTTEFARKFTNEIQLSRLVDSLENMLESGLIYNQGYDLYYHTGLDSLTAFLDELSMFHSLRDEHLFRVRVFSFCQYHKRNQDLSNLISKCYGIKTDVLKSFYSELESEWTILKNMSYYILVKKRLKGLDINDMDIERMKASLSRIIHLEQKTAENMILLCKGLE